MRISVWSSDVCSSDLAARLRCGASATARFDIRRRCEQARGTAQARPRFHPAGDDRHPGHRVDDRGRADAGAAAVARSEEHTSELQSLMRISYAVFCLKKKKKQKMLQIKLETI